MVPVWVLKAQAGSVSAALKPVLCPKGKLMWIGPLTCNSSVPEHSRTLRAAAGLSSMFLYAGHRRFTHS